MLTNSTPRIGILVGSTRPGSFNQALADLAASVSPVPTAMLTGLDQLPFFGEALESDVPAPVTALRDRVAELDALLVVTPEYNAGMPALLKNAIDWLSRPRGAAALTGLSVAVLGASPSPGGSIGGVADAVRVLTRAGARVVESTVTVPHAHRTLTAPDADLTARVRAVLVELATLSDAEPTAA